AAPLVNTLTNDTPLTAQLLTAPTPSALTYSYRAAILGSWDTDYYKVQAPAGTSVMTVTAWGTDAQPLVPRGTVLDASLRPVAAQVLVNENATMAIQVQGATPGATYYVKVQAAKPGTAQGVGNYFVGVEFGTQAAQLSTLAQSTLSAQQPTQAGTLAIQ